MSTDIADLTGDYELDPDHSRLGFARHAMVTTVRGSFRSFTGSIRLDGADPELDFGGSATDPFDNLRVGFEGRATINRKDFGLTWNAALEAGGFLVGDKVEIELDVSAIKSTATAVSDQAGES